MTGGTEREIRGRTTRTKGSPGQVVDRAGDSGLCRIWVGAVVKLRPRVFQHDETTCVLRFQQGKGGTWEIRCQFIILARGEIRCQLGKSGVSSSFLPEKTNRHRISRGDSDKEPIITEHRSLKRPLGELFEDMYLEALRCRLMVNLPRDPTSATSVEHGSDQ
jgi:hypothetical protein